MAAKRKAKKKDLRQCLFTKYEFEIGVLTFPVYIGFLFMGYLSYAQPVGSSLLLVGIIGTISSLYSVHHGRKKIRW